MRGRSDARRRAVLKPRPPFSNPGQVGGADIGLRGVGCGWNARGKAVFLVTEYTTVDGSEIFAGNGTIPVQTL